MLKGAKLKFAKHMRRAPTFAERQLWQLLRDRRLEGLKFRRQVPLGPYIVDFLCHAHRLIVEIDGPFHDEEHDALRDTWLRTQGFEVLRFDMHLAQGKPWIVFQDIEQAARKRPPQIYSI